MFKFSAPSKQEAHTSIQKEPEKLGPKIHHGTHTKKGHAIWTIVLGARVSREEFMKLLAQAKEFGGYYSKYSAEGAIPGFVFKEKEKAHAFLTFLEEV